MNNNKFMEVTANVSRAVSKDNKIKVVFGTGAYTDGDTITLPCLPAEKSLSYTEQMVMQGYRDHETMHILCSNMSTQSMKELKKLNRAEFSALNALEDIRIERCAAQAYIGMKQNIQAVNKSLGENLKKGLNGKDLREDPIRGMPPLDYGLMLVMAKAKEDQGYSKDFFYELYESASPEWKAFADKWAKKINSVPTGWNGKEIDRRKALEGFKKVKAMVPGILQDVKEIYQQEIDQSLQQAMQVPSQQPKGSSKNNTKTISVPLPIGEQGNGEPSEGTESSDQQRGQKGKGSNSKGQGKEKQEDGQDGSSSGNNGNEEQDEQGGGSLSSGKGGNGSPGTGFSTARELSDEDLIDKNKQWFNKDESLKELVEDIANTAKQTVQGPVNFDNYNWLGRYALVSPPLYKQEDGQEFKECYDKLKTTFNVFINNSKQDVIRAKRGLEIALQTRSDTDMESGYRHGGFDSKRVVHAINGNPYVFRQRKDGKDMDTIVTFLVDCSGSMSDSDGAVNYPHDKCYEKALQRKMSIACRTAYILCKACESVGAKTEVILFDDAYSWVKKIDGKYFADVVTTPFPAVKGKRVLGEHFGNLGEGEYINLQAKVHELSCFREPFAPNPSTCPYRSLLLLKEKQRRCDDPYSQAGFVFGLGRDDGGTPIGEAIDVCLHRLVSAPEKKKILAVLTDGIIDDQRTYLISTRLQSFADASNIDMLGIGIGSASRKSIREAFKNSVATSGGDLGRDLLNRIAQMIKED